MSEISSCSETSAVSGPLRFSFRTGNDICLQIASFASASVVQYCAIVPCLTPAYLLAPEPCRSHQNPNATNNQATRTPQEHTTTIQSFYCALQRHIWTTRIRQEHWEIDTTMDEQNTLQIPVFELNSRAVCQMQEGKYDEATATLQQAAVGLRAIAASRAGFPRIAAAGYGSQQGREPLMDVSLLTSPVVRDHVNPTEASKVVTESIVGDALHFQLFEMAFLTPYWHYEGTRGVGLSLAFVLYNLAICRHHKEIKLGTMKKGVLMTAARWYLTAMRIIRANLRDAELKDVVMLNLACINNLGHLYSHLQMLDEAQNCMAQLRSALYSTPREVAEAIGCYEFFRLTGLAIPEDIYNKAPAA